MVNRIGLFTVLSSLAVILCLPRGASADKPALARLSFRMPPERVEAFGRAYQDRLVPILKRHGLRGSQRRGRVTVDGAFSRLFELETPADINQVSKALKADQDWTRAVQELSPHFSISPIQTWPDEPLFAFEPYATPAGAGRAVPAAPGVGAWHSYDLSERLPEGFVRAIVQDRDGSLWFGTSRGVTRFDGQSWTTFDGGDGLAHSVVLSAYCDREGHLWFGTNGGGVSRYDGENWTTFSKSDGLAGDRVSSILQDREGAWWFGTTDGGVSRYDGQTWTTFKTGDGLGHDTVHAALEDQDGVLWFATEKGLSRYDGQEWSTLTERDGLAGDRVRAVLEDRDGHLWVGILGRGVSRYDGQTFTTFTVEDGLASSYIWSIHQSRDGALWLASGDHAGVTRYDGRTFVVYDSEDGLIHNIVYAIYQDREGHLWFGSKGGVNRYDGHVLTTLTRREGLGHRETMAVHQDDEGSLWFATFGGLTRGDGQTFTTFTKEDGLARDGVQSILQDRDGCLWLGHSYGTAVTRYDGRTFTTFTPVDGLAGSTVWCIVQDADGSIWAATGEGVSRHDPTSRSGPAWKAFAAEDGVPPSGGQRFLRVDDDGSVWVPGRGVKRYDGQNWLAFAAEDGLANEWVNTVFEDRDGNLWFGTIYGSAGVTRFDGESFRTFTKEDGLATNSVYGMLQDRRGHLWFCGRGGVSRYDGQVFQVMTTRDGLVNSYVRSLFEDREGAIWMSTAGGVTRYQPPLPTPPPVFIDAVVADRRYEGVSELSIPTGAGVVSFEYHGVSLKTRHEAMVYRYRLNGRDDDWRTTRAQRVEYASLPRGRYTFEVQAVDRDLVYSVESAKVAVRVHWPYERFAWMAALGVAALLVAGQTVRVVRRDRRLERTNQALSQANDELRHVNLELEAASREIEAGTRRKSEFLSRMSHDLRTPMNAIIGYTRILARRLKGAIEERQFRNLENIQTSADNLLGLINEILDISRIEAGRIDLEPESVDLGQLAEECIASVAPLVKPEVELVQDVDDVPPIITDADRVRRVVMNLLGNAVKFTEQGSIAVSLKTVEGSCELSVADTGVGIPAEDLPHIFEDYHKVERQVGEKIEGTGLGLAIARKSVEMLGGTISAESKEGTGTTFTVRIEDYAGLDGPS